MNEPTEPTDAELGTILIRMAGSLAASEQTLVKQTGIEMIALAADRLRPACPAPAPDEVAPKLGETCMHGQLKRQCYICELEEKVTQLRAEVARLNRMILARDDEYEVVRSEQLELLTKNTALTARVAELEAALGLVMIDCNVFHHAKKDRHDFATPCPVVARVKSVLTNARRLAGEGGGANA